ncbi:MAG: indolepyruvate oxidoreductase subunit beta [Candidatus Methanomethylicia archaeon]
MYQLPIRILIAGVGGQGNVLASRIIGWAAIESGYHVRIGDVFGAAQRGGSVQSHITIDINNVLPPQIPYYKANIILGFEPLETLRACIKYSNQECTVIMNIKPVYPVDVLTGKLKYPNLDYITSNISKLCRKLWAINASELSVKAGNPATLNMVMLGALAGSELTPIEIDTYRSSISKVVRRLINENLKAFKLGTEAITT